MIADTNPRPLVAAASFADDFVQAPPVAGYGYGDWLATTLERLDVDLYVPLLDADIALAAELAATGGAAARVAAPSPETARACCDKLETARALRELGVPGPQTRVPDGAAVAAREGLVVKPRYGQGSAGFRALVAGEEVAAADDLVLQQRCQPPEVTVDAYLAADLGAFRAVCRERLEVKAGVCSKARVFEDAELAGLVETVVRGLALRGGSCVQLMRLDGGWAVTDVNARPGGGTRMSSAAGVDILAAVYADQLGLSFDPEASLALLATEVFVVRQPDEFVV